jgi:hypothetical protein
MMCRIPHMRNYIHCYPLKHKVVEMQCNIIFANLRFPLRILVIQSVLVIQGLFGLFRDLIFQYIVRTSGCGSSAQLLQAYPFWGYRVLFSFLKIILKKRLCKKTARETVDNTFFQCIPSQVKHNNCSKEVNSADS